MAENVVGDVAIKIGLDSSNLTEGLRAASSRVGKFASQTRKAANSFVKYGAAATAAGVAITTAMVSRGLTVIDRQAKVAKALGATTAELQALARAADLSGVGSEKLEKGLKSLNKRLGDAVSGGGPAAAVLDRLSLSAEELVKLPVADRVGKIADAVNGLSTAAERSSALDALMSRGRDFTEFFEGGSASIKSATKEIKDFGVAVSEVDATSVQMANDAMSSIGLAIEGVTNQLTVALAPFLTEIANRFGDVAKQTGGFKSEIEQAVVLGVKGFGKVANVLRGLEVTVAAVKVGFAGWLAGIATFVAEGQRLGAGFVDYWVTDVVNVIIKALNKLPRVDITPVVGISNSSVLDFSAALADTAQLRLSELTAEFQELANTPLPSEDVEEFLKAVQERALTVAAAVNEARAGIIGNTGGEDGEGSEGGDKTVDPWNPETIKEQEQLITDIMRGAADERLGIAQHNLAALTDLVGKQYGQQAQVMSSAFGSMLAAGAQYSKKAFKAQKALAIGNAIVKGYESAVSAWAWGMGNGGPVVAAAVTAASLATTFGQIRSIRSQQFGGGGGGGGAGAGVAATSAAQSSQQQSQSQQGSQQQQSQQVVSINLEGEIFGREQVRGLIGQINDALDDGYTLRV